MQIFNNSNYTGEGQYSEYLLTQIISYKLLNTITTQVTVT